MSLYSDAERLNVALSAARLGDWSWDAATDRVTLSDRAAAIFGVSSDAVLTRAALRARLAPADAARMREAIDRALATRSDYSLEYRVPSGDQERWVAATGRGIYDPTGAVVGMIGIVQDVTDTVLTRQALQRHSQAAGASEERYRAFIGNSSEGIWRLEFDPPIDTSLPVEEQVDLAYAHGRLAECNVMMARMYGFSAPEELHGIGLDAMLPASDPDARAYVSSIIASGYRVSDVESRERDAHGAIRYFANSMNGVVIDGRLHRMWGSQRDITAQKEAERAKAYLAAIVDSADDGILAKNLDGIIQWCNAAFERIFGYAAGDLIGRPVRILIPADRQQEEDDILARLRQGTRIEHFETVRRRKDGELIDVSITVSPVRDASGAIIGASKIVRDITPQKRAAAELAAQQAWFRITLGSIGDAVIASDPHGRVTFLNSTASSLTGWSEAAALGHPLQEVFNIINEKTRQPIDNPATLVMKLGHVIGLANHTLLLARDGSERPIADSAAPIRDASGRMLGVVLVFRDVTHDRRAEDALLQQREWLQTTLESIGDAVIATDVQGHVVFINPVAEHFTGWSAEAARGRPVHEVFRLRDEQQRTLPDDAVSRVLTEGGVVGFGKYAVLQGRDGSERTIDRSGAPIRDREGRVSGVVLVFRDVSERRRADLERQSAAAERERLLDAERAARGEAERASRIKDEFVAMVSHELRTPLNAILGWTQLMMRGRNDPATVERGLDIVARNTRLQAQLISDLLDISRIVAGKLQLEMQEANLHTIAKEAIEAVRQEADAKSVALTLDLAHQGVTVAGDPARLQQVVWNLLSNAIKFTPQHGQVSVLLRHRDGHAELVVADTGAGIKPDVLPHVFDRFHQADRSITRRFGGLGLGLSIVKHLVELHGGSVAADSGGEGQGATFRISLPSSSAGALPAAPGAPPAEAYPSVSLEGLQVLVVEDEPDTRELLKRLLESHGAAVAVAGSATEALAEVERRRPQILISDIGLPEMDGYDLVQALRQDKRYGMNTIPAIALTAYARAEDKARALRAGFQAHLAKPIEAADLLMTIGSFAGMLRTDPTP